MNMIYLCRQKLDTIWRANLKWLLVNARQKSQMEGVVQIQFIFITLFITLRLCSIIYPGDTKSLPQPHTSSSLEKQKASVKIHIL